MGKILLLDNCFNVLPTLPDNSVDLVLTDMPYDLEETLKEELLSQSLRISSGSVLIFCSPENQIKAPRYLFWIKPTSTKNFSKNHGRFVEMIALHQRGTFNSLPWANMTGVYHDILEEESVHPYQKPLSLIERLVRIHTNPGDEVLDMFMGSNATGIACRNLGRDFIGIEMNPEYFALARQRYRE